MKIGYRYLMRTMQIVLTFLVFLGLIHLFGFEIHVASRTKTPSGCFQISQPNLFDIMKKKNWNATFKKTLGINSGNTEVLERTRSGLRDLLKYIRSQSRRIRDLPQDSGYAPKVDSVLNRLDKMSGEFINYLETNIETLEVKNHLLVDNRIKLQNISRMIQKKIFDLQNDPENCVPSKVLLCELTIPAGFASGLHDILGCFVEAFYTGKRVVLDVSKWHYTTGKDWTSLGFRPLSDTCKDGNLKRFDVKARIPDNDSNGRGKLMHIPRAIKDDLLETGVDPLAWWWGQFVGYIMRPSANLTKAIRDNMKRLRFTKPVVGLHIRRSDKVVKEACHHDNDVYMREVERYYSKLNVGKEDSLGPMNVYVATDDSGALNDLKTKYPEYNFIFQAGISELAASHKTRYNSESVSGLLVDLFLLAHSDYLVCTLSSGLCRLVFEFSVFLKSTSRHLSEIEVNPAVYSVDVPIHYTYVLPPKRVAILRHNDVEPDQLEARVGDVLEETDEYHFQNEALNGKLEDGFSSWRNVRTGKIGSIPNFKTKPIYESDGP